MKALKYYLKIIFIFVPFLISCSREPSIKKEYMIIPYPMTGSIMIHDKNYDFENGTKCRNGDGYSFILNDSESELDITIETPYIPDNIFFNQYQGEQKWIRIGPKKYQLIGQRDLLLLPPEKYWIVTIDVSN